MAMIFSSRSQVAELSGNAVEAVDTEEQVGLVVLRISMNLIDVSESEERRTRGC